MLIYFKPQVLVEINPKEHSLCCMINCAKLLSFTAWRASSPVGSNNKQLGALMSLWMMPLPQKRTCHLHLHAAAVMQEQVTLHTKREDRTRALFSTLPFRLVANSSSSARCALRLRKGFTGARTNKPNFFEIRVRQVGAKQKLGVRTALGPALLRRCSHAATDAAQFSLRKLVTANTRVLHDKLHCTRKGKIALAHFSPLFPSGWWRQFEPWWMRSRAAKGLHRRRVRTSHPQRASKPARTFSAVKLKKRTAARTLEGSRWAQGRFVQECTKRPESRPARRSPLWPAPQSSRLSKCWRRGFPNWELGEKRCSANGSQPRSKNLLSQRTNGGL